MSKPNILGIGVLLMLVASPGSSAAPKTARAAAATTRTPAGTRATAADAPATAAQPGTRATKPGTAAVENDQGEPLDFSPTFEGDGKINTGVLVSCQKKGLDSMLQNLSQIFKASTAKKGSPISATTVCGEQASVPATPGSCKSYIKNGKFEEDRLKPIIEQAQKAEANSQCRKGKLDAIQGELKCLSGASAALNEQIKGLGSLYNENLKHYRGDVKIYNDGIQDTEVKLSSINERLAGGKQGQVGLLALKTKMEELVAKMPGDILGVKEKFTAVALDRQKLEEASELRKASLANQCFQNSSDPSYKCQKNGGSVKLLEYVACRYEQNQTLSADGQVERDQLTRKRAEGNAARLKALLAQLVGSLPDSTAVAKSDDQLNEQTDKGGSITTLTGLEEAYGDQLKGFDEKGLPIHDFVMQAMGKCMRSARAKVSKERTQKGSSLGAAEARILSVERQTSATVKSLLLSYAGAYNEVVKGLTGASFNLNIASCNDAKPEVQQLCLDQVQTAMQDLLLGRTDASLTNIVIRGTNGQPFQLSCRGLDGCVADLQYAAKSFDDYKVQLEGQKKTYIFQANQAVQDFTKNVANQLGTASQSLRNRLQELNLALGGLGVSGSIKIQDVQGEEEDFETEKDGSQGLIKTPKNIVKFLSAHMEPPLLDINGDNFTGASESISSAVEKIDEVFAKVETFNKEIEVFKTDCEEEAKEKNAEALRTALGAFEDELCFSRHDLCDGESSEINRLIAAAGSILPDLEISQSTMNGVLTACNSPAGFISDPEKSDQNPCNQKVCEAEVPEKPGQFEKLCGKSRPSNPQNETCSGTAEQIAACNTRNDLAGKKRDFFSAWDSCEKESKDFKKKQEEFVQLGQKNRAKCGSAATGLGNALDKVKGTGAGSGGKSKSGG